jgi:hypothetical protein
MRKIILKLMLDTWDMEFWAGLIWLRIGTGGEGSVLMNCWEVLEDLHKWRPTKKCSAP